MLGYVGMQKKTYIYTHS